MKESQWWLLFLVGVNAVIFAAMIVIELLR